ncbi:MAG: hypothetical protein ACM31O_03845 [Bacteroidota bacterium]
MSNTPTATSARRPMHTVDKVVIDVAKIDASIQHVVMPQEARFISVQEQSGQIVLWYHGDPSAPASTRHVELVVAGQPAPSLEQATYLGAVQLDERVVHLFELIDDRRSK